MVESRNTVHDFIDRTNRNLKNVDRAVQCDPKAFFEVTQLINSAIGLLMFPNEVYLNQLPDTRVEDILNPEHLPKIIYGDAKLGTLQDSVKKIRNALAHYNVEFTNKNNSIVGLYLWTFAHPKEKVPELVVYISIESLRAIFEAASKAYIKATKTNKNINNQDSQLDKLEKIIGKSLRITNPSAL